MCRCLWEGVSMEKHAYIGVDAMACLKEDADTGVDFARLWLR